MRKEDFLKLKYYGAEKREEIREKWITHYGEAGISFSNEVNSQSLEKLFSWYDFHYFYGFFQERKVNIQFSISTRMKMAAGKTLYYKPSPRNPEGAFEIRIGIHFFKQYHSLDKKKIVSGVETKDALEALFLVFEHELCHVIEFYLFQESSCKKKRFKTLAYDIFGHTGIYHSLPTEREIVYDQYGLKVGNEVIFEREGKNYEGIIYGIHKRATVMVKDPKGRYKDRKGITYSKQYIPFTFLHKK